MKKTKINHLIILTVLSLFLIVETALTQVTHKASEEKALLVNHLSNSAPAPDVQGHALWALGVQIGFAELGSHENISPRLLQEALTLAGEMAQLLDCIPSYVTQRINGLARSMRVATSSYSLYSQILSLRNDLSGIVHNSCQCGGSTGIVPPSTALCTPSDWEGSWNTNYNQMTLTIRNDGRLTGFYNTSRHRLDGRPLAGNPCVLIGTWTHASGSSSGRFRFEMTDEGKFEGKWTRGQADPASGGSKWTGRKN